MNAQQLKQIAKHYHRITNDNINGVFYGYKITQGKMTSEKGLVFMVNEKKPLSELAKNEIIPKHVSYKNTTLITDIIESRPKLGLLCHYCNDSFYEWETTPPVNNDISQYAIGGIGLYNGVGVGTLGFLAIDNDTDSIVGITNSHVAINDPIICSERKTYLEISNHYNKTLTQGYFATPTLINTYTNTIGKIKKYVPLSTIVTNQVDGTAIAIEQDKFSTLSSWKIIGLNSVISECMEFATTEELNDILNMNPNLYCSGIRTGAKGLGGVILKPYAINGTLTTNITIAYNSQEMSRDVTFDNVQAYIAVEPSDPNIACFFPANSGDSGSAVLASIPIGNGQYKTKIIGLLFAISFANTEFGEKGVVAFFNRIDDVANQLNIRAIDANYLQTPRFSNLDNIENCVVQGLSNEKYIILNDKKYWQVGLTTSTDFCQEN